MQIHGPASVAGCTRHTSELEAPIGPGATRPGFVAWAPSPRERSGVFGPSSMVVQACLTGRYSPLMGAALLAQYEDVLGRSKLFETCRLSAVEREELLDIFVAACRWTRIYYGWRPNLRDEGDNHLVELAVAGGADTIVTHNIRRLKTMELRFPGLAIATPAQLLAKE